MSLYGVCKNPAMEFFNILEKGDVEKLHSIPEPVTHNHPDRR